MFLNEGATVREVEVANGYAASLVNIGDIDGDRRYNLGTTTHDATATATAWHGGRTWNEP